MSDDVTDDERKESVGEMIQKIAEAVEGASIHDGMSAMAYVFADIVSCVPETCIHSDLYTFGEMVLAAVESMDEFDEDDDDSVDDDSGGHLQ